MESLALKIEHILLNRKWNGIQQNEIYRLTGYSRSHVSEVLAVLESQGKIVREKEGKLTNRIWFSANFPHYRKEVLRVGFLRSSEYVPFLSSIQNVAESSRIALNLRPMNDATEMITELQHNSIDIALAPTFTHLLFSLTEKSERLLCGIASGGSGVIENTLTEDSVLATSEASTMSLISRGVGSMDSTKLHFYSDPREAMKMFLADKFKYIAVWEPYLSNILSAGNAYNSISSGEPVMNNPCCSAGISLSFFEKNRKLATQISRNYAKFVIQLDRDSMSYGLAIISEATGFSMDAVYESLGSYTFSPHISTELLSTYTRNIGIPLSADRISKMVLDS